MVVPLITNTDTGLQNIVIYGLGGVGKSFEITALIEENINKKILSQNDFLILTFDKRLRKQYVGKSRHFNHTNIRTVHSLCYYVLKDLNQLPEKFMQKSPDEDNSSSLTNKDYDRLVSTFLSLQDLDIAQVKIGENVSSLFNDLKLIVCDEIQDFREDYIDVVRKIKKIGSNTKTVFSGDRHQRIYSFQDKHNKHKLSDVILNPSQYFGQEDFKIMVLRKNYRIENVEIQKFINDFLVKAFNTEEAYLYDIKLANSSKWKRKPIIHYFTKIQDEITYVQNEIEKVPIGLSIGILGRGKKDIEPYKRIFSGNQRVSISTVHEIKGGEKDYIFYVGFNYDKEVDTEIPTICFTAISRASKRLFITSSHPIGNEQKVFSEGTYELLSTQKALSKPYIIRNRIIHNKNFTWKKIKDNNLDSLVLKVREEHCPFLPYIKKLGTQQHKYQSVLRRKTEYGMEYSVKKHHSSKAFYFEFKDLNLLKRNSYSDIKIIYSCANEVLYFFDNRVKLDDINIHEVDLCKFIRFEDKEDIRTFFEDCLEDRILESKHSSIMNEYKEEIRAKADMYHFFSVFDSSLYVNHHSKKYESLTSVFYYPLNKENENKIHMDNLYKIEMRARGRFLERQLAFGDNRRILDFLRMNDEKELEDIIYRWIRYYYGENIVEDIKKLGV